MAKVGALDLGDVWVGVALSDGLRMFAKPYQTTKKDVLEQFLITLFAQEQIDVMVVGLPKTMKGTESEQTKLVRETFQQLQQKFPAQKWVPWDERLSSQWAQQLSKNKQLGRHSRAAAKEDKLKEHARAAAYVLESYLSSVAPL